MQKYLTVNNISVTSDNGLTRVEVVLDGKPLWFESRDAQLTPTGEAFVCGLLFPALMRQQGLQLEMPLSQKFLNGVEKLLKIFNTWWDLPILMPTGRGDCAAAESPRAGGIGQCFTCGVDSFHTLVNNLQHVTHLVFVSGFDIPLQLKNRLTVTHGALREVAEHYGKKLIVVRTNLREHPIFRGVNWEHAHGAALVAVAHLLVKEIGKFIIPSTFMYGDKKGWGSTAETDPLWSSERLQVEQYGASMVRLQKIGMIVNEPMARKHLRVCWEMRKPLVNCSVCEKCIRTMLCISLWAPVEQFTGFDHSISLLKRVDSLPGITRHVLPYYRDFLESALEADLKDAIRRLLQRSGLTDHEVLR